MVRGKIQMKRIENATSRQVTFSKRRNGLLKKAYELSVLCDAEVAAIIFSQKGKLYEFASSDMQKTLERYRKKINDGQIDKPHTEQFMQQVKQDIENMVKKIEFLEVSKRRLLGQDLESCSIDDLHEIDGQLERSLRIIRTRKAQLFNEQVEQLKEKERLLLEENASLCKKCEANPLQPSRKQTEAVTNCSQSCYTSDVETELFIGLPEMRIR